MHTSPRWFVAALALTAVATLAAQDARPLGSSPAVSRAAAPAAHQQTIDGYCVGCHSNRLKAGDLSLEGLAVEGAALRADTWERVVRKLRIGAMPPQGARRPDQPALDGLATWLEDRLDRAAAERPNPGRPALHRLNRSEYANAVRDLLGLDVDVSSLLPPDNAAFGFDNIADALGSSPALLQAYLSAARRISAVAVGDPRVSPGSQIYSSRQDLSQGHQLDGMPLGTVGGIRATHTFPVDGEYEFQVRMWRTNLSAMRGLENPHDIELALDGARVLIGTIGGPGDLVPLQKNPTLTSDTIEAQRLRVRALVKAGQRQLVAAVLDETPAVLQTARLQPFIRDFDNPFGAERAPHVQSITVTGPFAATSASQPPSPTLFVCRPAPGSNDESCARRIATTLARHAYRRPLTPAEADALMDTYRRERVAGTFETGVGAVVRRVLASPSFVFRPEDEPAGRTPGGAHALGGFELASRLSFFLWSSIPDEELLRAAAAGQLASPAAVRAQVRRMLANSKANALTQNFAGQWLYLRNLRGIQPNTDLFPDFDDNLRQAMRTEVELFFSSVVREDRSVVDLLTANDTFLNERLARHYGVPDITGSRFRRVHLADDARRGLLGKGAILLATSHATTTSPVLRGKWVLDNIMGAPPPAPPPDVPALQEPASGQLPKTMRAQMELHRTNAQCASCHKLMDPIGFAMENFDAVGAWRTTESGAAIDSTDVLLDGTRVVGVNGLRTALAADPDVFVKTLVEKLLTYALGRGLRPEDMPVVRAIVKDARQAGYKFSSIALGIANSAPFRMRTTASVEGVSTN